jgi:hypothetical protein
MKKPFFPLFTDPIIKKREIGSRLTADAKKEVIPLNARTPSPPWYQLSVIRMNSTYLECVDVMFGTKGMASTMAQPLTLMIAWMAIWGPFRILTDSYPYTSSTDFFETLFTALFIIACMGFCFWLGMKLMISRECFRYTHTPIRFNRKNRKAYFFQWDGTVLEAEWEKLKFVAATGGLGEFKVAGFVMEEDGVTIRDTFILPSISDRDERFLYAQFEFVRRYMEEPEELPQLAGQVENVMAIYDRRESWYMGFQRLFVGFGGGAYWFLVPVAFPLALIFSLGRWTAMHTCTIPRWPARVEEECAIEPNDPYLRDRDHLAAPGTVKKPEFMR